MCFVKSSKVVASSSKDEDIVERHEADASVTKNSTQNVSGYQQNLKTSPVGLTDSEQDDTKKHLLGE